MIFNRNKKKAFDPEVNSKNFSVIDYAEKNLENALDRLFLDKNALGYWDDSENRIIESLYHDTNWNWKYKPSKSYRYSLFCMSMLLLSKEIYSLNTYKYDEKIKKFLLKIKSVENTFSKSELTYGGLLCLVLGEKIYGLSLVNNNTKSLLIKNIEELLNTNDNQDYLLLIAAYYFDQNFPSVEIPVLIKRIQNRLLSSLNEKYFFDTGDIRAPYHQRVMYTVWGLIFSSSFGNYEKIENSTTQILNHFFIDRKFEDNAFLWCPRMYFIRYRGIKFPVINLNAHNLLFECHQTFYVNSIIFYRHIFQKIDSFYKEKQYAMEWIFGKNRNNENLVDLTGISLPQRLMNLKGNYFIRSENFKGSYEIGSYILALSSFIASKSLVIKIIVPTVLTYYF